MKKTKKSLLFSGLALMMSALLLAGTTFAWFTDSVTNKGNTIQAGILDVTVHGYYWESEENGWDDVNINYGLSAPMIQETTWEPGQYNAVVIKVSNWHQDTDPALAAKIGLEFNITENDKNLADALWYKLTPVGATNQATPDRAKLQDLLSFKDPASRPASEADDVTTMSKIEQDKTEPVTIYADYSLGQYVYYILEYGMYTSAGNDYQGGTFGLDFTVNATQATYEEDGFGSSEYDKNAEWPEKPIGDTAEDLVNAVENAKPGDVLTLPAVTYELTEPLTIPSGVTLLGAQAGKPASEWVNDETAEKTVIKAADGSDRVLKIEQNAGETVTDVVLDGILVDGDNENVKGIFVKKYDGAAMTGIAIRNCAVIDCGNDGIDVNNTDGAVIENNYVAGISDNGIALNSYKNSEGNTAYIRNNVVKNIPGTINGAIAVSGGKGDVVVTGNTVESVGSNGQVASPAVDMGESAIVVESVNEGGVITIENNTLTDVEQGIAVYKFSAPTAEDKVVIRNNTVNTYSTFAVATSTLNYSKFSVQALVEIADNTFGADASTKGAVYVEETNRYNETTTGWQVVATGNTSGNGTTSK